MNLLFIKFMLCVQCLQHTMLI